MLWISFTQQFGVEEIGQFEQEDPADLLTLLMASSALFALRATFEVMMNGGEEKLRWLLSDARFNAHWQDFYADHSVNTADFKYAEQLELRLKQMTQVN